MKHLVINVKSIRANSAMANFETELIQNVLPRGTRNAVVATHCQNKTMSLNSPRTNYQ